MSKRRRNSGRAKVEAIAEHYPSLLVAEGFHRAVLGTAIRPGSSVVVAYDLAIMEKILVQAGMPSIEARKYLDERVLPAYVGDLTPTFIDRDW